MAHGAHVLAAIGRALLWGLIGALVAPVAALAVGAVAYRLSGSCGIPGDNGGCEMGVFATMIASVPLGAGLFALASLAHSLWRGMSAPGVRR